MGVAAPPSARRSRLPQAALFKLVVQQLFAIISDVQNTPKNILKIQNKILR